MVCGTAPVWVERGGRLERTGVRFAHLPFTPDRLYAGGLTRAK